MKSKAVMMRSTLRMTGDTFSNDCIVSSPAVGVARASLHGLGRSRPEVYGISAFSDIPSGAGRGNLIQVAPAAAI
jgi:hypothetical protein